MISHYMNIVGITLEVLKQPCGSATTIITITFEWDEYEHLWLPAMTRGNNIRYPGVGPIAQRFGMKVRPGELVCLIHHCPMNRFLDVFSTAKRWSSTRKTLELDNFVQKQVRTFENISSHSAFKSFKRSIHGGDLSGFSRCHQAQSHGACHADALPGRFHQ